MINFYLIALKVLFMGFFFSLLSSELQGQKTPKVFKIEDFDTLEVGSIPPTWRNRDGDIMMKDQRPEMLDTYHYSVQEEDGNHFLRFEGIKGKHLSYPLADKKVRLDEYPYLNWSWRAIDLPEGANEEHDRTNDAVLSVYVVYKILRFTRLPKVIRYSWSSSLEEGVVISNNFGKQKIVILNSGEDQLGQWITHKRNLIEDYREFFGGDPPNEPIAILILSDADNVQDLTIGDYDNFFLSAE